MIFILNGDNVGEKMSEHVMSNDAEGLKASSDSISAAIKQIIDSIENMGGTILSNSGDEVIASLDNADSDILNQIKQMFEGSTGHTATIAIGETLDQTAKALVYAKMNQPGEIVQYDPSMDEELAGEQGQEDSSSEQGQEGEQEPESNENNQLADSSQNDEQEESDEQSQDNLPVGNESDKKTVKMPVDEAVSEHEELVDVLNSPSHEDDKAEAEKQGQELDQYKEQQQEANQEEAGSDDQEGQLNDMIQQDMESEDNGEQSSESEDNGEEDFGDVNSEDGSEQSEDDIPFLNEDDIAQEGQEQDPNMEGQEQFQDGSMDEQDVGQEQEQEQSPEIQNLKNQIGQSLMVFKENKQIIDSIEQSNPDLYAALHAMISSMVDMGNMLIGSPDESQDSQDGSMDEQSVYPEDEEMGQEGQEQYPEQDMGQEDIGSEQSPEEGSEEEKKKPLFGKSEDDKKSYGYSKNNPKIDIYHNGKYLHSTNWAKNLTQAREKHLEMYPQHKHGKLITSYANAKDSNKSKEGMAKARVDEGKSIPDKQSARRERNDRMGMMVNDKLGARHENSESFKNHSPEKIVGTAKKPIGVNVNYASKDAEQSRGESDAGRNAKASNKMNKLGQYNTAHEQKQTARRHASGVLSNLQMQKKPNLPKSETDVVKAENDLNKAVVDEGKSKTLKQYMRRKRGSRQSAHERVKGVHQEDNARIGSIGGESVAGNRAFRGGDMDNERGKLPAKIKHREVIAEQKAIKTPNLPKSETGINVRNPNITVHDFGGKYNEKSTKGRSGFGQKVRDAKSGKIDPQDAVDYGKGKLKEFQEQKKPNLPKSETDVVKSEKLKSFLKKNLKK